MTPAMGEGGLIGATLAGGMGEVYRARDTRLNREVAVKVLPAAVAQDHEGLARFEVDGQRLPNAQTLHHRELRQSNGS